MQIERKTRNGKSYYFVYGYSKKVLTSWNTKIISFKEGKIKLVSLFDNAKTVLITCIEKLDKLSEGTHGISSVNLTWNEFYSIDFHLKELRTPDLTSLDPPKTLIQTEEGGIEWE